jgi:hypothetical protein
MINIKKIFKKKRVIIEHTFEHLKKTYKIITNRYDKLSINYLNFIYLTLVEFVFKKY